MEEIFAGEIGAFVSGYDWSQTPLGAVETWSSELKTAVQILVAELDRTKTLPISHISLQHNNAQRYQTLLESIDRGFCICEMLFDSQGSPTDYRFIELNRTFEVMTGLEQALGKTARELVPDLEDFWFETYGRVVLTGKSVRFEHESITMNRWFDVNAFPVDAPQKHRFGVLFDDISDRKRIEAALKQSEENFRHLIESIPQLVWTADRQGRAIDVNQRWLDFTGLPNLKEAQSVGLKPFIHPDDIEVLGDRWALVQQEGIPLQAEGRIRRHDGVYRWYLHLAIPVKNEQGEVIKWFGTGTDIDEQKQLEQKHTALLQKIQERNQELDSFSHIVSHDLKAPLRAISNLAQWLEDDLADKIPSENQLQLQLMRSRAERMEALINGLLSYAHIAREDMPLELVSVEELLAEIIDSLDPLPPFTIEISPPLPTFATKRLLLNQVLTNLISNAIKHHDRADGKVKITVQDHPKHPEFYEFAIADDGKGIDPQQQTRIFDIFQTVESHDNSQNTGIGLAIVKKIVEAEGNEIYVKSEIGKGSTFYFTWRKFALDPAIT
jgi:PAS domain S-box-containing protein